ncbi:MAG TPA: adenylate/guanylate cyclase domain-containing protein, partial [Herpetosiphonaceae bacterium]|nr:adenylate/guanylate cyclase domain-containing protein [Herpetosiphonaceae bacterium]
MNHLLAHLPLDRLQAVRAGRDLPLHATGTVVFADISGFTPLTELLLRTLGSRRGAEALTSLLDRVYDPLIAAVHAYGGSVIGFSGDAITTWFPGPDARPALACALAMQRAMDDLAATPPPAEAPVTLKLKVCIARGPVQRMVVGDPAIQLIDVLAGPPLDLLGAIDHLARPGEALVEGTLAEELAGQLVLGAWREDPATGARAALLQDLRQPVPPRPTEPRWDAGRDAAELRAWVAPAVLARLEDAHAPFLTELRPVVALFLRFGAGEETIDLAGVRTYISAVQGVLARYEATLIQVTLGEKGSYLYAAFGAPIAHEDDIRRAVRAAMELRQMPMDERSGVQIGIAQGIARTGLYGSAARQTYGVLGDAVNLAARLMQHARPGQILANDHVWSTTSAHFHWQTMPPLTVKGKRLSIEVASLRAAAPVAAPAQPVSQTPLAGREAELRTLRELLGQTAPTSGQAVAITGAAGIGKSRLVHEGLATLADDWLVIQSATQSYGAA